ncbi:hypothetical protein IFM89_003488 [Coptis chinensis]|uniref:CCHC-type domain-containing protein n=1 Tax=Coptis chinensis TaxID=261450 RepID=A0A835HAJ0_9MAGN|nr:hypothetical protein IFM89_003488 [Coptis chinensis]
MVMNRGTRTRQGRGASAPSVGIGVNAPGIGRGANAPGIGRGGAVPEPNVEQPPHEHRAEVVAPGGRGDDDEAWQKMVERFIKLKPEKFSGTSDLGDADNWREDMKKIFNELDHILHDRPNDASKTDSKKENKDKYDNYSKRFKAQNQQGQNSQPWKKQRTGWQNHGQTRQGDRLIPHEERRCYRCGDQGHIASYCKNPRREFQNQN